MAILGFHIVVSLIALTVLSKFGSRVSFLRLLVKNLIRYLAPTNDELRALMPAKHQDSRPRKRRQQREEEETNGFNVPRQMPLEMKATHVRVEELERFPLYSSLHWLTLYVPVALVVYGLSEAWIYYLPQSKDINISIVWLAAGIAFSLQIVVRLTAMLLTTGDSEKHVMVSLSVLLFFVLFVLTVFADRLFDVSLLEAYTELTTSAVRLTQQQVEIKPYSPLLLYISMVVMFSTVGCGLIFPSFRYASMYARATRVSGRLEALLMHTTFFLPMITFTLFTNPIKLYLTEGRRVYLTHAQLESLRIYLTLVWAALRLITFRPLLQAHLDTAYDKVVALQKQSGKIKNTHLQTLILRYYSYLCPAVGQYIAPVVIIAFTALLSKSTGGITWSGEASADWQQSESTPASFNDVFTPSVNKAFLSFSLLALTATNAALSLTALVYTNIFTSVE